MHSTQIYATNTNMALRSQRLQFHCWAGARVWAMRGYDQQLATPSRGGQGLGPGSSMKSTCSAGNPRQVSQPPV